MVREIFGKFADGLSPKQIAADFNARRIPSPGSTWKRTHRRATGWMGSAVREMLRNPRYRGVIQWNKSEWRKDPDTGKRKSFARPQSEWITHLDESMRIVSDDLWDRAQRRIGSRAHNRQPASGGKPKFLLSGLLICDNCQAHYVISDKRSYGCSGYHNGRACSNAIRVRRDRIEAALLDPVRQELLSPERVEKMARDLQAQVLARLKNESAQAVDQPHELRELAARIDRLRERLRQGDPDMTPDEIQAAIDRAEEKRRGLQSRDDRSLGSKLAIALPRAAELYRRQISLGLEGDPRATIKARMRLRELFGGKVRLVPQLDGGLIAHWNLHPGVLLKTLGTSGSGGSILSWKSLKTKEIRVR